MKIKTSSNTEQAFWIALGGLFSFGFSLISSMILSRYFTVNDYGTYKQVLYVYNTLLIVFTLGLPKAYSYFLPRVELFQAKSLIRKITNLFFILGLVFSILLFFFSSLIADLLNNQDLELAIKIFSPVPFLMLPTMGLEAILSTFRMTKFMTIYTVLTRILMLICVAVPVMFFESNYINAIIGFVIASFVTFLLALYFKYLPVKNQKDEVTSVKYWDIFNFSLPLLYASLWGMLINSSDQFFISRYFNTEVFAQFSNGALELPFIGMILGSTAAVLSPVFSKMSHNKVDPRNDIFPIWINVFNKSVLLIYPLLMFSIFFADVLMITLYGEKYYNSSIFFIIFNISYFFKIIIYAPLIINTGSVNFYQRIYMFSAIILILLDLLCVKFFNSPYLIVLMSVIVRIIRTLFFLTYISKYFSVNFKELFPLKLIINVILSCFFILAILRYIFVNTLHLNSLLSLIFSFIFYLVLFSIYAYLMKFDYVSIIKPLFSKFFKKNKIYG